MRIVKENREDLKGNVKGIYLISPYINDSRQQELKANKITYIKATGEQFLTKLKKPIDDTIVADFKESRLEDNRVFYEYLHNKGLNPIVQFGGGNNIIDRIAGYNGASVQAELNLKISNEVADAINRRLYNASHGVSGTKFRLPACEVDVSSLIEGELRYNGVLFGNKSDWQKFLLMPAHQVVEWTIKVPSADFIEKTKVCVYRHSEDSVGGKFDIKIGEINIILRFEDGKPVGTVNIQTELYESYESSSEALRWVEVPIALFEGKSVDFQLFRVEGEYESRHLEEFRRTRRYYRTVRQLELEYNVHFTEYSNYSDNGLMCALILLSYLSKNGIGYALIKRFKGVLAVPEGNADIQKLVKKGTLNFMAVSYTDFEGVLNGYKFKIPYVNICFRHCQITDYHLIAGNRYFIEMVDKSDENIIYGSDTPVNKKGDIISLQG